MPCTTSLLRAASRGLLVTVAAAGFATRASAQATNIPTLFSTGVLANGAPAPNGSDDLHYQAYNWTTAGTLGTLIGPAQTLNNGYQPTGPGQTYYYTPTARWVWSSAFGDNGRADPTNVAFHTTFDLTGFDLSTVTLVGRFGADNFTRGVYLNGVLVNSANAPFQSLADLMLTTGFVSGLNTLDLYAENQSGGGGDPAGFIFDASATGSPVVNPPTSTVPEPGSVALLAAGLAGVTVGGRRVRRA